MNHSLLFKKKKLLQFVIQRTFHISDKRRPQLMMNRHIELDLSQDSLQNNQLL
jgi:phage antirepressor YoqD-like protein